MEENLDKNNEVNKEISDNTTKPNSEEIKEIKLVKKMKLTILSNLSLNPKKNFQ